MSALPEGLIAKWQARTVPVDGGHLLWTGYPGLRWGDQIHQAVRIAFAMRTDRTPVGYVRPDCGLHGCVAPDHVDDRAGRERTSAQLDAVRSFAADQCPAGHDQAAQGRTDRDGNPYCRTCAAEGTERMRAALELQARYYDGWSVKGLARDTGRSYRAIHNLLQLADTEFRQRGFHGSFHRKDVAA